MKKFDSGGRLLFLNSVFSIHLLFSLSSLLSQLSMKDLLLLPSGKIICWWYLWGANYYLSPVFMRFQLLQYLGARYNIEISTNVTEHGLCSSHPSGWPPSLFFVPSSASFLYLWGIYRKVNFALCSKNSCSFWPHPTGAPEPLAPDFWLLKTSSIIKNRVSWSYDRFPTGVFLDHSYECSVTEILTDYVGSLGYSFCSRFG